MVADRARVALDAWRRPSRAQLGRGRRGGSVERRGRGAAAEPAGASCAPSSGGGFQLASRAITRRCRRPRARRDVGAAEAELARARAARGASAARRADGERRAAVALGRGRRVPSHQRMANGRSGSASAISRRAARRAAQAPIRATPWRLRLDALRASIRTTSHARPAFSSPRITPAEMSISQRRRPCAAEVGNAWWLLCHASPNESGASHARLRDSSSVANARRPKKWHSELIE